MTLTKSESARINGAKSRGPKTSAGKAKSSRNAIKHGLFAQVIVLSNENAQAFDELTEDFIRRFEPRDGVELSIVEQMVAATWRLSRCWEMQTQTLNLEMQKDQDEDDENLTTRGFPHVHRQQPFHAAPPPLRKQLRAHHYQGHSHPH